MNRTPTKRHCLLIFLFLYVPYVFFNHSHGWNQAARFAELHAIVLRHTLTIDAYHQNTGDKAYVEGHYYCEKPPTTTLLALPAFAVTAMLQQHSGIDPDSPRAWGVSQWITTAGSVGLVTALGGVAFFILIYRRCGDRIAHMATAALFLGSIAFPYATALFPHATTIGLLAISLWAVLDRRSDILGGVCAGLAIASEYPAVFPAGGLLLYLAAQDRRRAFRFAAGLTPGIALILIKNTLVTGSPLVSIFGFNPGFKDQSAQHAFGFGWPNLDHAMELLWGEYRGLLFWCPALAMALPGLWFVWREDRLLASTVLTGSVFVWISMASFSGWQGGEAIGPRYLSPALPFLGLAMAHGMARFPRVGLPLTTASVMLTMLVVVVDISPPQGVRAPLREFYLPLLQQNRLSPNLGSALGLQSLTGLFLLFAIVSILALLLGRSARRAPRSTLARGQS